MDLFYASGDNDNQNIGGGHDMVNPNSCHEITSSISRTISNLEKEPSVGMVFKSEDEAYAFYNAYAKSEGFSVRKSYIDRRADHTIQKRTLVCSFEGERKLHSKHVTIKPQPIQRTNCMARIVFQVDRENIWTVGKFVRDHNYTLTSPNKRHLLRSQRKILPSHVRMIERMDNAGISQAQAYNYMTAKANGIDNLGFIPRDYSNLLRTKRLRDLEKGDMQVLLDFLKTKQSQDPSFFYAIQVDSEDQLANFFWADTQSILDYAYFGDVICFDTTFRTNKYDMLFAPFIGINHHEQTIIFGVALLLDETTETFVWLFRTFMIAMSGRQPKTIFTDQCAAMSKAINIVFPFACHRLCLWHIFQNAAKHLSHIYHSKPNFQREFKGCIYEAGAEEDFQSSWHSLITKYNLVDNSWINSLYGLREKWALVYRRTSFCATMTTTQRSESMNIYFKRYFNGRMSLSTFIKKYHSVLAQFRRKEIYEDFKSRNTVPNLLVNSPMLSDAAKAYTRKLFSDFQEEFMKQIECIYELLHVEETRYIYKVSHIKWYHGIVHFDSSTLIVGCSFMKFESMGILCMHSLKVLYIHNILQLPSQYILKRWSKYPKDESLYGTDQSSIQLGGDEILALQSSRIFRKLVHVVTQSDCSKELLDFCEHEVDKLVVEVEKKVHDLKLNTETTNMSEESDEESNIDQHTIKPPAGRGRKDRSKGRFKSVLEKKRHKREKGKKKSKTESESKTVRDSVVLVGNVTQEVIGINLPSQSSEN